MMIRNATGVIHCPECNFEVMTWTTGVKNYRVEMPQIEKLDEEFAKYISDIKKCPECGGMMFERLGKKGMFWRCKNYPKCQYTMNK